MDVPYIMLEQGSGSRTKGKRKPMTVISKSGNPTLCEGAFTLSDRAIITALTGEPPKVYPRVAYYCEDDDATEDTLCDDGRDRSGVIGVGLAQATWRNKEVLGEVFDNTRQRKK